MQVEKPFAAYSGKDEFVFVCYAHDDAELVYPEIEWLHQQGLNLWYDEGISPGQNWRSEIGLSLDSANKVLFYISPSSLQSHHCNREINYALDAGKEIVPIYLERIELTPDLKIGLNRLQLSTDRRWYLGAIAPPFWIHSRRERHHSPMNRYQHPVAAVWVIEVS